MFHSRLTSASVNKKRWLPANLERAIRDGQTKNSPDSESLFVPKVGLEPTWGNPHYALNVARLPIPPLRLAECIVSTFTVLSTWTNFFTQWIQSCFLSSGWPVVGQSCNSILMRSFAVHRFCLQDCNVNVLIGRNKNYIKTSCRCTSQASTRRAINKYSRWIDNIEHLFYIHPTRDWL